MRNPESQSTVRNNFKRASFDRNMTANVKPLEQALASSDLKNLIVLDFGCGQGSLLRLLQNTDAKIVYAFEIFPEYIDADIKAWADDPCAMPRLIINPQNFKIDPLVVDGDLTNYDYFRMLMSHEGFAIVSNPPYFLYNRILSLTGDNLARGSESYTCFKDKFRGALMITSKSRLHNYPGWEIRAIMDKNDFNPAAANDQYVVQTGLGIVADLDNIIVSSQPQKYIAINDRNATADMSDYYPEMWKQLNNLQP